MDKKAIIEPGTNRVINLVLVDPENVPEWLAESPWAGPTVSIGCTYVPETDTYLPPPPPPAYQPTSADVNAERDRRLVLPFTFGGKLYDRDPRSLDRITGAATLAGFAMGAGAGPGNLFWHGGTEPFAWIANDNTITTMDAPTTFAFGQAAAAVETQLVFAARALKDMNPIPADYTDDVYWT